MSVVCSIKDYELLKKKIEDMKVAPNTVLKRLTADAKKRVPPWVAAEVSKVYGVKKAEINNNKIGKVTMKAQSFDDIKIVYTGRPLTPTHFSMAPTTPPEGRGYSLKATIIRGQRSTLGKVKKLTKKQRAALGKNFTRSGSRNSTRSPVMLMHTGNAQAGGTNYIPFQRKSTNRKDIEAVKTISLPQMVSSQRTKEIILTTIVDGLDKRLNHYMDKYMGR